MSLVGQVSDPGDNSLAASGSPGATPSTHRNPCFTRPTGLPCTGAPLGPGQPRLHSTETKACSLASLWGRAECYLGVCCPLYLLNLSSGLHLRALTCSDLGCTGRQDLFFSSGPCCQPQQAKTFLGWYCLWQQKVKTNLLRLTCSKLGLQLPQTTTDWPEALAYPHQPYSTDTSDTGKKSSFPWFGES